LVGLTAGQVSPVVTLPEGKAIYKIVSITNSVKDFDKNKDRYRKEYISQAAKQLLDKQIEEFKKSPGVITFLSPGYKAFYDYSQAMASAEPGTSPTDKMQAVYEEAKQAESKNEGYDAKVATLARYAANNYLWGAPGVDKAKLVPERIDTLLKVLENTESFDLRKELVDLYIENKQYDEAADQLLMAARNNSSYDATGYQHFSDIRDMLARMQKANQIKAPLVKEIQTAQLDWSRQRAEYEKQQAEAKKEQAKQEAEFKAAQAKAAAEEKAKAKAAKPAPGATPPATTSGLGLTTGSTGGTTTAATATTAGSTTGSTAGAAPKR
jgi:hypothetical protein